jgi:hypothetical protein
MYIPNEPTNMPINNDIPLNKVEQYKRNMLKILEVYNSQNDISGDNFNRYNMTKEIANLNKIIVGE